MSRLSAKNKIIILLAAWFCVSASMFFYFFTILDAQNQKTLNAMSAQSQILAALKGQNQDYLQSQADLQQLAQEPIQPEDFFSRDITLVKEIETLENLGAELNVSMALGGVAGTVATAPLANTKTPMVEIPYSLSVTGSLVQVEAFIQSLEHLGFTTDVTSISLSAASAGQVNVGLESSFYLLK